MHLSQEGTCALHQFDSSQVKSSQFDSIGCILVRGTSEQRPSASHRSTSMQSEESAVSSEREERSSGEALTKAMYHSVKYAFANLQTSNHKLKSSDNHPITKSSLVAKLGLEPWKEWLLEKQIVMTHWKTNVLKISAFSYSDWPRWFPQSQSKF